MILLYSDQNQLTKINKKTKTILFKGWFVDPQGFEPRMTVPKTGVLPLHYRSVLVLRNYRIYFKYENQN